MAPDANGVTINLGTGDSVTETLVFNLDGTWQVPDLELVLFLQTDSTKEILQGKKYSLAGLTGAYPLPQTALFMTESMLADLSPLL